MSEQTTLLLNDGNRIPRLGLGVWKASQEEARLAVAHALRHGYRHVDTAAIYENEEGVGRGLREAGIAREALFVTTKVWNADQGYQPTLAAVERSLTRLQLDYLDLLLIHWPAPGQGRFIETWQALIQAQVQSKVRSIGVSNFNADHLQAIIEATGVRPVLNQIELHPTYQQNALRKEHARLGIATQAWSPLGQGSVLGHPTVLCLAAKHGRTPAQIILRWHLQSGVIAIPKSVTPARIEENLRASDFNLDEQDLMLIASMEQYRRLGPDPAVFN